MTGSFAAISNASLGLVGGIVAVSVVLGIVDMLRQPTWAWRAAGEPKSVCLLLVLFLPGVGLAIYVFGARPKIAELVAGGRAATLPFERFGDQADTAVQSGRAIQALSWPTTRGSFGEPLVRRPALATDVPSEEPAATTFFEDPDVVTVGGAVAAAFQPEEPAPPAPVATDPGPAPAIRIPGQAGRPYNPKQRVSIDEGPIGSESLAGVAAQVASGPPSGVQGRAFATRPVPQPAVTGPVGAGNPSMPAPRVGTSSPEIFRAPPQVVAPIVSSAPMTLAPQVLMAPRWMNDPTGRHQYRFWDGGRWTENVYDAGVEARDSVTF
jgi:hypothetical protein